MDRFPKAAGVAPTSALGGAELGQAVFQARGAGHPREPCVKTRITHPEKREALEARPVRSWAEFGVRGMSKDALVCAARAEPQLRRSITVFRWSGTMQTNKIHLHIVQGAEKVRGLASVDQGDMGLCP